MKRTFDAKIRKVGNSYIVTIPSTTIKRFRLKQNTFLTVDIQKPARSFDAKLRKVGNSNIITIPSLIINRFKLKNKYITITIEND